MSREIKFRAWDDIEQKMFIPYTAVHKSDTSFNGLNSEGLECSRYVGKGCWHKFPIMQFTGLRDKHGVEIWEGDIVTGNNVIVVVVWNQVDASFELKTKDGGLMGMAGLNGYLTVIGNIYENKDLLG